MSQPHDVATDGWLDATALIAAAAAGDADACGVIVMANQENAFPLICALAGAAVQLLAESGTDPAEWAGARRREAV